MSIDKNNAALALLENPFKAPYEHRNLERIKLGLSLISRPTVIQRQAILFNLETARAAGNANDPKRKEYDRLIDTMIIKWWPEERE